MSITIELPAEVENRIRAVADAEGTDVAAVVSRLVAGVFAGEPGDVDPEVLAALREGIEDADAGRTVSLEAWAVSIESRFPWIREDSKAA